MKHNFYAGPGILPQEVLKKASQAALKVEELDLSILEISHRSQFFSDVLTDAEATARRLWNISDEYAVLFLTGGASTQFFMVPMNLLAENETAAYVNTGKWATNSIKEAKLFGNIDVVGSSEDDGFNSLPTLPDLDADKYKYLYLTSNNTIYGTQYHSFDGYNPRLVCDMSSDIWSKEVDVNKFDLIFAGSQKNSGAAGSTIVIVKKDILGKTGRTIPTMLDYQTHIKKNSSFNTPPVFPIYVNLLTFQWLESQGGVSAIEKVNNAKADLLYGEIDRNPLFKANVQGAARSKMNITFTAVDDNHTQAFLDYAAKHDIVGIKGHRSAGGFRASTYNALPLESVQVLVDVMRSFEQSYG